MSFLLDDRKLTDRALAHIQPVRVTTVSFRSPSASPACTAFLYAHMAGGWLVGRTAPESSVPNALVIHSRHATPAAKLDAVASFSGLVQQLRTAGGAPVPALSQVLPEEGPSYLTPEQELSLADNWVPVASRPASWAPGRLGVWSPDAPDAPQVWRSLHSACTQALRDALAEKIHQFRYLDRLALWLRPTALQDSRVWAFLFMHAAQSAEEGLPDVFAALERYGAPGLCKLLSDEVVQFLDLAMTPACSSVLQGRPFRFTLADLVDSMVVPFSFQLREAWTATPLPRFEFAPTLP